jgi:hypothetical protein
VNKPTLALTDSPVSRFKPPATVNIGIHVDAQAAGTVVIVVIGLTIKPIEGNISYLQRVLILVGIEA